MSQVEKLLVFLASPSDVPKERRIVEEIIAELNHTVASEKNVVLQVVRWENDAFPGYGKDAQSLINAQIAEMGKYALFVGIMWNRLGTATPRAESGTVEEFERAAQAFRQNGQPEVWFYFRQAASDLNTEEQLEQRKKVLGFKQRVQANGLPWPYRSPSDFRNKFQRQITLWLNKRAPSREMSSKDVTTAIPARITPLQAPVERIPVAVQSSVLNQLRVGRILMGGSDRQERCIFDIQLENPNANQVTLDELRVSWKYLPGALASVSKGELLNPISEQFIYLNIDPMDTRDQVQSRPVYPTVVLPAGTRASPSVALIRIELIYQFSGKMNYHPTSDWNISYSLALQTTDGVETQIFNDRLWR